MPQRPHMATRCVGVFFSLNFFATAPMEPARRDVDLGPIADWRAPDAERRKAAVRSATQQGQLPTHTLSLTAARLNVRYRLNPPYRFRE